GVGGAVDVADAVLALDGGGNGELLQGGGGLAVGLERVDVLDDACGAVGHRGVGEGDLLVTFGLDGEDLHLQQVVAEVLQQSGVLGASDDAGVDVAGLLGLDEFAFDLLAVDDHGERVDAGAFGYGEDVGGFQATVGVVAEGRFDVGGRDLVVD